MYGRLDHVHVDPFGHVYRLTNSAKLKVTGLILFMSTVMDHANSGLDPPIPTVFVFHSTKLDIKLSKLI